MFGTKSAVVCGFSNEDVQLANELMTGVSATLERIRKALDNPDFTPVGMGQVFEFLSQTDKAEKAYERALDHSDPDIANEALARYTVVLLKQDRRLEALRAAERLAARDPKFVITSVMTGESYASMTLLGDALFLNGRLEAAENAYDRALELLPDDPFVSGRMALLNLTQSKSSAAISFQKNAARSTRYADLVNTLELVNSGVIVGNIDPEAAISVVAGQAAGRPFRVEGSRVASLVERNDWT